MYMLINYFSLKKKTKGGSKSLTYTPIPGQGMTLDVVFLFLVMNLSKAAAKDWLVPLPLGCVMQPLESIAIKHIGTQRERKKRRLTCIITIVKKNFLHFN